jgi:hypothetical protein
VGRKSFDEEGVTVTVTVLMGRMGLLALGTLFAQYGQYLGHVQDSGGNWKHFIPVVLC